MGLKDDLKKEVSEYLETGRYETTKIDYIPDKTDRSVTFGNKGLVLTGTALHIDMRNSTMVMKNHHKDTVAKLHKAYLHVTATLVKKNQGHIRSFNGDGMLAFFPEDTKGTIMNAVKSAMHIKYVLSILCKSSFERYHELDFGIGIHHGNMLVVKTGLPGDVNNDLLWIGEPVNMAVKMGDGASSPSNIRISSFVYQNLLDDVKYAEKRSTDFWGREVRNKVDMWRPVNGFQFGGESQTIYETGYYWEL